MKNRVTNYIWTISMVLFFVFLYIFNITMDYTKPADANIGIIYEKAKVTKILSDTLAPDPSYPDINIGIQEFEMEIKTGKNKGKSVIANNFVGRVDNKPGKVGTEYIISSFDSFTTLNIVNYSRETSLYILSFIFLFVVIYFGKMKGLKSIFSLVFSLISIVYLFIPMIIRGMDPIIASVIVVIISTIVTLTSLNGWSKKSIIAGISCIICTVVAGLIAFAIGELAHISSLNTPETEELIYISTNTSLKIKNLFFAGILIASVGAIMDTTMSIASSVSEMKQINPRINEKQLYKSAMNIGKDIMGTMTNTLILAFTGSSVNMLIMLYMYKVQFLHMINMDVLVVQVIQGLSASIAVALSIPITAFIAARTFGASAIRDLAGEKAKEFKLLNKVAD